MSQVRVAAERRIGAPAGLVYRLIADSEHHHHRFLPPAFSDFRVERGGYGAGTIHSFKVTLAGVTRTGRMEVREPEPGRVIAEADTSSDLVTTFTVEPAAEASRVRIETTWTPKPGLQGLMDRLMAPRLLRGLYADELRRLDEYARSQARGEVASAP